MLHIHILHIHFSSIKYMISFKIQRIRVPIVSFWCDNVRPTSTGFGWWICFFWHKPTINCGYSTLLTNITNMSFVTKDVLFQNKHERYGFLQSYPRVPPPFGLMFFEGYPEDSGRLCILAKGICQKMEVAHHQICPTKTVSLKKHQELRETNIEIWIEWIPSQVQVRLFILNIQILQHCFKRCNVQTSSCIWPIDPIELAVRATHKDVAVAY